LWPVIVKRTNSTTNARQPARRIRSSGSPSIAETIGFQSGSARLRDLPKRNGSARGEIADYLRGEQTVGADRAFWIGEALHELGVAWCSGPASLFAAGLLSDFVSVIANLDRAGHSPEAAIFAALSPLLALDEFTDEGAALNEPRAPWRPDASELRERANLQVNARTFLAGYFAGDTAQRDAFQMQHRLAFMRESERGWNAELAALVVLSRCGADPQFVERIVWRALLDWALENVDDKLCDIVLSEIDGYEKFQQRVRIKRTAEIKKFTRRIMSAVSAEKSDA
jgi:hypothetical protein